jgi:hypothetical protein
MHPLQVAAKFAAFTWHRRHYPDADQEHATRFARTKWHEFLPVAHEGLGRLLLRMAKARFSRTQRRQSSRRRQPALAPTS